jgi:hypothetical protein
MLFERTEQAKYGLIFGDGGDNIPAASPEGTIGFFSSRILAPE